MMDDIQDYANRIGMSMWRTQRKMSSEVMEHKQMGLTGPQFYLLNLIDEEGAAKVAKLAERMDVKPSAATVMLDRLEQSGFIERQMDKQDRRAVIITLTDNGSHILDQTRQASREVFIRYLSVFTPQELETFAALFEKLEQHTHASQEEI